MIKKILVVLFLCFSVNAATTNLDDCEQATVEAAITAATSGDTLVCPADDVTWSSLVTIPADKTIKLLGNGGDNTKISFSGTAIESLSAGSQITGFWFYKTGANTSTLISIKNTGWRIDHNKIENSYNNNYLTYWAPGVYASGVNMSMVPEGLVDNNTMINVKNEVIGAGNTTTKNAAWYAGSKLGTSEAVYFEDNIISRGAGVNSVIFDLYYGARAVFRFNIFSGSNGFMHSWQSSPENSRGVKSWEIYGNTWTLDAAFAVGTTLTGGTGIVFNEYYTAAMAGTLINNIRDMRVESESCDGDDPIDSNEDAYGYVCRDQLGTGPDSNDAGASAPSGANITKQPAYFWNNMRSTGAVVYASLASGLENYIVANRDYYDYDTTFDGTTGVGAGTLASIPATCTTGVGYWATDQGDWNTLGDDGILYKCTSTDTWTEYYEPYTYPHPLRGEVSPGTSTQTGRNGINVNGTRNAVTIPGATPGRMGIVTY